MSDHHAAPESARDQGYLTIAYGPRKYFEMALNLALSVKLNDPSRPIALLYDGPNNLTDTSTQFFDHIGTLPAQDRISGSAMKLNIFAPSPYSETLFVDADCLVLKKDMDRHWNKFAPFDFNIPGNKRAAGSLYGLDVTGMMRAAGTDHIMQINSGIIFFRKNDDGKAVFDTALNLFKDGHPELIELRGKRGNVCADQPFFGAAMAKCGIDELSYTPQEGTIMATTYLARNCDFDLERGVSTLEKPTGHWILNRFLAKGWVKHSTSIGHFIALKPKNQYQSLSDQLRKQFDVEPFDFLS